MMKKILVVDDEEDILKEVTFILRKKGFEVLCAADGKEALEIATQQNPDLILLDLFLPIFDGTVVGKRLKTSDAFKHIPIILLTASADNIEEKRDECMADDYILKPFDYKELLEKLSKFLS